MDGFFLYYMKSAFTMLKYRVFSYDANERILFMKLGSGMYKEIARDALKGNWMKAIAAGFAAGWLGVFSSSFLFIAGYVLVAVILVYFLEFNFISWYDNHSIDLLFYWRSNTSWLY